MDKYIDENKLNKKGKKKFKLNAIIADILRKSHAIEEVLEQQHKDQTSSDIDSDSDHDLILEEFGSESETGDEHESEHLDTVDTVDPVPLVVQTRYGRYAGNWALSELQ